MSAILLRAERDLAWLGARLGRDVVAIEARIADLEEGFEQFWNPAAGTYCSIDLLTGAHAEAGTSAHSPQRHVGELEPNGRTTGRRHPVQLDRRYVARLGWTLTISFGLRSTCAGFVGQALHRV